MIRAKVAPLEAGERTLDTSLGHYLARVLRLRAGDGFVAFDPSTSREADAVVVSVNHDTVRVSLGAPRAAVTTTRREVIFVQGLAKGDKCDAIVRDATELGATRIVFAHTERSMVKLDAMRAAARTQRWMRIAEEAARQCGRSDAPALRVFDEWSSALGSVDEHAARFCLYERATEPLGRPLLAALSGEGAIAFAAGPEGGLADAEVAHARAAGWAVASLGDLTLRAETVAAAVLGAVRIWSAL